MHLSLWFQTLECIRFTGESSLQTRIPGPRLQRFCFSTSLPDWDAAVCGPHSEMLVCGGCVFLGLGKAVGFLGDHVQHPKLEVKGLINTKWKYKCVVAAMGARAWSLVEG